MGNSRQQNINGLRALIEVGAVSLVERRSVESCNTLQEAIWLSMSPQITHRQRSHQDYADEMGMSKSNFSKKVNGGNLPQDFLVKLAIVTRNALPIQWQAKQIGFDMILAPKTRLEELKQEIAELERAGVS